MALHCILFDICKKSSVLCACKFKIQLESRSCVCAFIYMLTILSFIAHIHCKYLVEIGEGIGQSRRGWSGWCSGILPYLPPLGPWFKTHQGALCVLGFHYADCFFLMHHCMYTQLGVEHIWMHLNMFGSSIFVTSILWMLVIVRWGSITNHFLLDF